MPFLERPRIVALWKGRTIQHAVENDIQPCLVMKVDYSDITGLQTKLTPVIKAFNEILS